MPPAVKRNICLMLFDLKSSNKDHLLEGLIKFATHRFLNTKDDCRLLLTNCSETDNSKNVRNVLRTEIDEFMVNKIFKCISEATPSDEAPVNLLDVLSLAIHYILQVRGMPGIITLQIVYFTDLSYQVVENADRQIADIVEKLNINEIYLCIVGPVVSVPTPITNLADIPRSMQGIIVDESNNVLVAAKKIVQATERSVLCNLKLGINLALVFKKYQGTQAWQVPISIGSLLNIPVKTSKIYKGLLWKFKDKSSHRSYNKTYLLKEDQGKEIQLEDLVHGIIRHSKFVKIDSEDMFKSETERQFSLVCFTDSKFVSEPYIGGDSTFHVLPGAQPGDGYYDVFVTLAKVLMDEDKCMIVQRVYNKNNNPKFFVLKPEIDEKGTRLVMTNLPYADSIRGEYIRCTIPEIPDLKPEENALNNFCQSIDIHSDKCRKDIPFTPNMMINPYTEVVVEECAKKLCGRNFDFEVTRLIDFEAVSQNQYENELRQEWAKEMSE